jgi:hypothetical protein
MPHFEQQIIRKILLTCALSFFLWGCDDILEEDISTEQITIIAPANGVQSGLQNIGFHWESADEHRSFRIQVATPDFAQAVSVVVDSLVDKNSFKYKLEPGKYEWRVRAENSAFKSDYSTAAFSIVN